MAKIWTIFVFAFGLLNSVTASSSISNFISSSSFVAYDTSSSILPTALSSGIHNVTQPTTGGISKTAILSTFGKFEGNELERQLHYR